MTEPKSGVAEFDRENLWAQEIVTDMEHGDIKVLHPVTADLFPDDSRKPRYFGFLAVAMGGQQVRVDFEIEADSFAGALDAYVATANAAGHGFIEKIQSERLRQSLAGAAN